MNADKTWGAVIAGFVLTVAGASALADDAASDKTEAVRHCDGGAPEPCATTARREPSAWSVEAQSGVEVAPLAAEGAFARGALAATWLWRDRWFFGAELAVAHTTPQMILPNGATFVSYLALAGARIHAGRKLDVLLGWRVGHAGLDFGFAYAHATAFSPILQMAVPLRDRLELRIEPVTTTLYWADSWQWTLGMNVGVAWRP